MVAAVIPSLGDHTLYIPVRPIDDLGHGGHNPFRLLSIQPFPLQPLNEI